MLRTIILWLSFGAAMIWAQCGTMVVNPTTGLLDCTGTGAAISSVSSTDPHIPVSPTTGAVVVGPFAPQATDQSTWWGNTTVTYSTTPAFTCASGRLLNQFVITLTGNVTAPTFSCAIGTFVSFQIIQDGAGNHAFTWPAGFTLAPTVDPGANITTFASFVWDGSNADLINGTNNTPLFFAGPVRTAAGTPASGVLNCWADSTGKNLQCKGDAGAITQTISTTAGGDLSGTLPSPTVAKVNGVAYAASPANHSVEVITAANTATAKVVPDCQDSSGNHINYTQSTDSFSCGTTSSSSGGIVTTTFSIADEFVGGTTASGGIGSIGWLMTTITAAPSSLQEPGTWPNLGVIRCTTAAAAQGDGCAFNLGANSIGPVGDLSTNTNWDSTWIFRIGQTTTTRLRIGFEAGNSLITQSTDGFWARYDTNASFADTTFQLCARTSSGTEACFNTTVAADTNFHKVRIRSTVANKILMTFDAGAEKSFCAAACDVTVTPSTVAMTPMMTITTDTTAAKFAEVDYFAMQMTGLTR